MESTFWETIYNVGVIPVIQIDDANHAVPLVEALSSGGLPVVEITLRTHAALDSIRKITREFPDLLVGAGTVINEQQGQAARAAGARFLVSPGLDEGLVLWTQEQHIPIIPGAVTPSEIMHALRLGITLLKFFPADAMGGTKTIKSISAPFAQVGFIPTGGIRPENLSEYLQLSNVHAVGGSWIAAPQTIREGRFDEITRLTKAARDAVKSIRG